MDEFALLVGVGGAVGLWRLARALPSKADVERWLDAGLVALGGALGGARIGYVALNWGYYVVHPLEIVQVWLGGLSAAGALVGGLALGALALLLFDLPLGEGLDRLASMLPPLAAAAWLGCWLVGNAYGALAPAGAWWALPSPDESGLVQPRFPLQPLAALTLLVGFAGLEGRASHSGQAGALALLWLGLHLAIFSALRGDPRPPGDPDVWAGALLAVLARVVIGWILKKQEVEPRIKTEEKPQTNTDEHR